MKTLKQLMDLRGRVALITGGAGHVGSTFAEALAEVGATIVTVDSAQAPGKAPSSQLHLEVDLSKEEMIRTLPKVVLEKFGRLDVLVNCAAFVGASNLQGWNEPFTSQSPESWRSCMEVNLTAPFLLSQIFCQHLSESPNGSIINVASIYGLSGPDYSLYADSKMGNPAAYAVSKGGILQMTRWLSTTLAPKVRVNSITPGGILRGQPASFIKRYEQRTPLQRMATEEDLKGAILYLASDLSSYVTGQNIIVDGGWTTW